MNIRTTCTVGLTAFAFALVSTFGTTSDAQSIDGDWEVSSGAMYGKLIPSNVVYTMTLNVTGDQFTADSGNLTSSGSVTADNQTTPAQVTFKIANGDDPGRELKGIFKFEGRNLMITFSETDEFPTSFESTADNKYLALSYQANTGRNNLASDNSARRGVANNRRRPTRARQPATPPKATNKDGSGAEAF